MIGYTRDALYAICTKYIQNDRYCESLQMPELLKALIVKVWVGQITMDPHEEFLVRHAYEMLSNEGFFNFEDVK